MTRRTAPTTKDPQSKPDWATKITAILTSLTAIGALVFTALSLQATHDQLEIATQGQFTDRYAKAVAMLDEAGNDHSQARLGAIYSLERLALDSPRDSSTIVAVLSAFIRTSTTSTTLGQPCIADFIGVDVQAALTVLGRNKSMDDKGSPADLHGACLPDAQLQGAYLRYADLRSTQLRGSDLEDVDLSHAQLEDANLAHTNLEQAVLDDANATGTVLTTTNLDGAAIRRVDLDNADLTNATHDDRTVLEAPRTNPTTRGRWW